MQRLLSHLWSDDAGSILAAEYLLLSGTVIVGAGAALHSVSTEVRGAAAEVGQTLRQELRRQREQVPLVERRERVAEALGANMVP